MGDAERADVVLSRVRIPDLQKARRVAEVESETGRPAGCCAPRRRDTPVVAGRAANGRSWLNRDFRPGIQRASKRILESSTV